MLDSDDKNAKATLYYTVKVNDKAVSYPGTGSDETGNVSQFFYIHDEIYADIYSDSSSDGIHLGLTNKELIQILNGNEQSAVADSARAVLDAKKYECNPGALLDLDAGYSFEKAVNFSISPNNSPTFTVGGYEYENNGTTETSITNDGVINVTVTRGADQHSLKADTVRLLLEPAEYDMETRKLVSKGEAPVVLLEAPEIYNAEGYSGEKTSDEWDALREAKMKNGDNISISINIGSLAAGEYYIVKVEGRDAENNEVEAESGKIFGFAIARNMQPPVVIIDSSKAYNKKTSAYDIDIVNTSDIPDAKILLKGKVTSEIKQANVTYKISVTDASGAVSDVLYSSSGTALAMTPSAWPTKEHEWTFVPTDAEINGIKALDRAVSPEYTQGLYYMTVSFDAESKLGEKTSSSVSRSFYIDTKAPDIDDVQITPIVTYDEALDLFASGVDYANGTINFKANVNDNHTLDRTDYVLKAVDSSFNETTLQSGFLTGNTIKIQNFDTTREGNKYDGQTLKLELIPVDKAGNKGAKTVKSVIISQETDKPVIYITNADKNVSSSDQINREKNLFDLTSNNKILGSVSDDDSLESISVKWKKAGASDLDYTEVYGYPKNGIAKSSSSLSAQFLKSANTNFDEGLYSIKITATDDHGMSGVAEFLIAIDDKDPNLVISSKSDSYQTSTVVVNGTIQDSSNKITLTSPKNGIIGIYEISDVSASDATVRKKMTADGDAVTLVKGSDYTVSNSIVTINWSDSFACVTGGESLSYIAEDRYGKTTSASYSYLEDQVSPSVSIVSPTAAVFLGKTLSSFQKFSGTATDPVMDNGVPCGNSGISLVEYKYAVPDGDAIRLSGDKWTAVDAQKANDWLSDGWQAVTGSDEWVLNLDCSVVDAEGAYVWFRAVDGAGNKTSLENIKWISVTFDNDVPKISIAKVTSGSEEISASANVYYVGKADLVITGSVKETYVPVDGSKNQKCLSVDNPNGILTTTATPTGFDFTYSLPAAKVVAGQNSIKFNAVDKATQASSETVSIYVDALAPDVEIGAITPQVTANGKENNVNGTITVSGNASDDDKVLKTLLYINGEAATDDNGAVLSAFAGKVAKLNYSDGGSRFSYSIDTKKWDDESALTLKVVATDRSGNASVTKIYNPLVEGAYNQKELYIDQSTDIPTLTSSNMNLDLNDVASVSSADGGNLYGMGSQTVYITATDDDGVKSVTYRIDEGAVQTLYTGSSTSVTKNITFADDLIGEHKISFVVTDINNTSYSPSDVYFAIDNDVPVITGIKIGSKTYEKDMFVPKTFTIAGSASDDSGVSSVTFTGVPGGTTAIGTSTWTSSSITETEGNKNVKITAKDKYGRSSSTTISYKVDITAPEWKETAGGAVVPTTVSGGQKSKTNVELASLIDAGTPFWYNSDSVTLSGKAYDVNEIAGYTLSVNGGPALTANGGSSYSIISSYNQGSNTALLIAKDTAGNETSRTIAINVDTVDPVLDSAVVKVGGVTGDRLYIKADSTVKIDVAASDATSGISKILIGKSPSFSEGEAIAVLDLSSTTAAGNRKSGTIDISAKARAWTEGANTIYVRALDVSGLSSAETILSGLIVDKTAPVISYSSHSENEKVNKLITLSGNYVEANKTESLEAELYYRKKGSGSWTKSSANVTVNSDGTWQVADFDTQVGLSDESYYEFQIRMSDAAGNSVGSDGNFITLHISQNSDRPVIKLNFATDGSARLNSGVFAGTVSDDDGDIKNLYVQTVASGKTFSDTDSKWTLLTVTSGAWEIPEAKKLVDGTYTLYFKVVDAKNASFKTSGVDGLTVPYIQYSTNAPVPGPVTFSVDTAAPNIDLVDMTRGKTSTADENYSGSSIQNNDVLGGVAYRFVKFKIDASDSVSKGTDLTVKVNIAGVDYDATYGGASDKFYYTENVDFSTVESKIHQLTVTATDQANMAKTFTKMVIVDNVAPDTIKNVTPSNTTEVTGDFSMTGLVQDDEDANSGIPADGEAMWYYIPKYSERNATGSVLEALSWTNDEFTRSSVSWSLKLGNLADIIGYNSATETVGSNYSGFVVPGNSALYDIPVWFKVMDNAGNIGYIKNNFIHFNPNADKPTVAITYPGESEKEEGKIVMGGTARFQGTASDNEGIEGVYLQFDMNGDGVWENGEGISGVAVNDSGKVYVGGDKSNVAVTIPVVGGKGFKVKGTLSWTSSIDLSGITVPAGKTFNVRAIAIDSDEAGQLASAWTNVVEITINNDIPQYEQMYLVQYNDAGYTSFKQQIKYEEDVFISGNNWCLEGKAKHKDGIQSITVDSGNTITTTDNGINKDFRIVVNPTNKTSGAWTATVTATDKGQTPHQKIQQISVNIDNEAPTFADGSGELVLYKDAYGIAANKLSSTVYIQNSNGGFASISSKIKEIGSGFARAVFYFERDGASEKRVYNVMKPCGVSRIENKSVLVSAKADGKVYINSDNLPVLYKASVGRSSTTSIELTTNDNIRIGSLVKIGGAYHRIVEVTATSVSLSEEVDTKFNTDAEFVYAMVVDNSGESRNSDGTVKSDDGDGMVEGYVKSGTNYTWDAEIASANIPDGPIDVHVVLFDKAGNISHSKVQTRLANNAPRITTVKLGTDLNGDGSYSDDEYEKFYVLANHSNASGTEIWNLDTKKEMGSAKNWTVKNNLSVVPEFVGGTAPFKYVFTTSGASAANLTSPVTTSASSKKKGDLTVSKTDAVTGAVTMSDIRITNAEIGTAGEGKDVTYQFSFWDSTEETTSGVDSSWTILNASVRQVLNDNNKPAGYIRPFYWKDENNNSLYQNSKNNGHIELENDWKNASGYNSGAANGVYDADPKVSGKIVLRGMIYDDVRLGSLGVTFADFGTVTISSFVDGAWSSYSDTTGGKIPSATVTTQSIGQNGHVANYEIVVDTSKISGVTGADKAITLTVKDAKNNTFTSAAANGITSDAVTATYYANDAQVREGKFYATLANAKGDVSAITTVSNSDMELNKISEAEEGSGYYKYEKHSRTGYYKVDVVPYISGISTRLDDAYSSNTSVFNRSANGKYPVRQGETNVKILGFNLKSDTEAPTVKLNSNSGNNYFTVTASSVSEITGTIGTAAASGEIEVTVNSVSSLNNKNADTEYNQEPNKINNNTLDDNRGFWVWKFAQPVTSKTIRYPSFRIGKDANQSVGFIYDNGGREVRKYLAGNDSTLDTSYSQWFATACAVDNAGNIYGSAQNGDSGVQSQIGNEEKYPNYKFYAFANRANGTNYTYVQGAYSQGGNNVALEWAYANNEFYPERIQNPKIALSGSNVTKMANVYYDKANSRLVFRYGEASYTTNWGTTTITFNNSYGIRSRTANTASSANSYVLSSDANVGEYAAVGFSGNTVVVAYKVGNSLMYKYNTNPSNNASWATAIELDGDYVGEYCDLAVDPDGGIHIAYFRAGGRLKYAYLSSYNAAKADVCTVDSYLSVGTNISIEVSSDKKTVTKSDGTTTTRYIPYISYFTDALKLAKVAWPVATGKNVSSGAAETFNDGVATDQFTGSWEVQCIPTPLTTTLLNYSVGVGVKNNGTENSVMLGYGTKTGLETALLQ